MYITGPIGVFDSGYGGLTILTQLQKLLPEYDFLYLGDNARSPYGTRSFDVVYDFTLEAVEELFSRNCSLVILACNTASAKALRNIQQNDLPNIAPEKRVLGVIRPSAEEIGQLTKTNHVGLLATQGTIKSDSYRLELLKFAPQITLHQHACPMWVPLIENNQHLTEAGKIFLKNDLEALLKQNPQIDVILLGCTHYPLVKDYLSSIVSNDIHIVSQGSIVAEKLVDYLQRHPEIEQKCSKTGRTQYLTTETSTEFDRKAGEFIGQTIQSVHIKL